MQIWILNKSNFSHNVIYLHKHYIVYIPQNEKKDKINYIIYSIHWRFALSSLRFMFFEKWKSYACAAAEMNFWWTQHIDIELLKLFTYLVSFHKSMRLVFVGKILIHTTVPEAGRLKLKFWYWSNTDLHILLFLSSLLFCTTEVRKWQNTF